MSYLCPLCQAPLTLNLKQYRCAQNHSFDIAKEGYVNLLPVQNKKSKDPGDNKDMVLARRAFLEKGFYAFLQQALADTLNQLEHTNTVIDLGCGEGFYTQALQDETHARNVFGLDISKPAVKYAAKRYSHCEFSVASISNAPFGAQFADCLVSVFAPLFEQELARLVKPHGHLIVASPAPDHLTELKQIIYSDVKRHQAIDAPEGFTLTSLNQLTNQVELNFEDVKNLVMMTPFAWKFRPEHWQQLEQNSPIVVTLDFYLSVFERTSS